MTSSIEGPVEAASNVGPQRRDVAQGSVDGVDQVKKGPKKKGSSLSFLSARVTHAVGVANQTGCQIIVLSVMQWRIPTLGSSVYMWLTKASP